jgi:serine/threonine protein kinase
MSEIIKEGKGSKMGGFIKNWKSRWFVLQGTKLVYLDKKGGKKKGDIDISTATDISPAPVAECPKQPSFKITLGDKRTYFVQVQSPQEVREWIAAIEKARAQAPAPSPSAEGSASGPASPKKISVDDFELIRVIGRGSYGKVQLVRSKANKHLYALKSLRKSALREADQIDQTMIERNVLLKTVHPFLVGAHFAFQSETKIFLVLDYVPGGELFSRLREEEKFSEARTQLYAAEILVGLGYLHEQGFVYRDLKPENILVDRDGHLRITDFGLVKTNMVAATSTTSTFCGTPEYIAPEMLQGKDYTKAVDWWSFGILVYELLCGIPPFYDENSNKMYRMVVNDPVKYPKHMSLVARDLVGKLLQKDPAFRLGSGADDWKEIRVHGFFNGIDWDALLRKEIKPEWKPQLTGELDTGNFDEEFTAEQQGVSYDDPTMIGEAAVNLPGFTFAPDIQI